MLIVLYWEDTEYFCFYQTKFYVLKNEEFTQDKRQIHKVKTDLIVSNWFRAVLKEKQTLPKALINIIYRRFTVF